MAWIPQYSGTELKSTNAGREAYGDASPYGPTAMVSGTGHGQSIWGLHV
ncbi:uncharacterized protein FMAN_07092 [Fusarium mangiferae]|uniref:Uncharacterized protein n=1 Tax=Fusarium mangiferae TaxID=192010 RepID=A0A1L7T2J1_FUSMA|nr:uncharacterized protein FMAN_07092 [Fusarium mangiferae]CVK92109.1 uncharacterized protein FMAN_07092 [Fusarium mangiferae]